MSRIKVTLIADDGSEEAMEQIFDSKEEAHKAIQFGQAFCGFLIRDQNIDPKDLKNICCAYFEDLDDDDLQDGLI